MVPTSKMTSPSTSDKTLLIDSLNKEAWKLRYLDSEASKVSAEEALKLAKEENYFKGQTYACMNLAVGHFLRSENKEALELLTDALGFFNEHREEPGYASTLTYIGNIYESFGDYERALEYCQNAYNAASEIGYKEGLGEAHAVRFLHGVE